MAALVAILDMGMECFFDHYVALTPSFRLAYNFIPNFIIINRELLFQCPFMNALRFEVIPF